MFYCNGHPIRIRGELAGGVNSALFVKHSIECVVLLIPRREAKMPGDPGIYGRSHEVLIGFWFKTERRAKSIFLGLHGRDEGIMKIPGRDFIHSLQAITVLMASAKSSLKS